MLKSDDPSKRVSGAAFAREKARAHRERATSDRTFADEQSRQREQLRLLAAKVKKRGKRRTDVARRAQGSFAGFTDSGPALSASSLRDSAEPRALRAGLRALRDSAEPGVLSGLRGAVRELPRGDTVPPPLQQAKRARTVPPTPPVRHEVTTGQIAEVYSVAHEPAAAVAGNSKGAPRLWIRLLPILGIGTALAIWQLGTSSSSDVKVLVPESAPLEPARVTVETPPVADVATIVPAVPPQNSAPEQPTTASRAVVPGTGREKAKKKREPSAAVRRAVEPTPVPKEPAKRTDDQLLADILNDGGDGSNDGGDAATPSGDKTPARRTKPVKTTLDRSDVAVALGSARKKAVVCGKRESDVGTVMVKFTVDPSGKVSKAAGQGELGKASVGQCVVRAVKKSRFPAFDGRPMSFTYPFQLSK